MIEEQRFANFIHGNLFGDEVKGKNLLARKIAASLLLAKYALCPYEKANNWIATIKGLVILCSHILALVEKTSLPSKYWQTAYQLCRYEINECLRKLKVEVLQRNNIFLEGGITGDGGAIYEARTTIILGWLSAYEMLQRCNDDSYALDSRVYELIRANLPRYALLWGESASMFFIMMGLFLSLYGEKDMAAEVYKTIVSRITARNGKKSELGLPDPYYSADQILAALSGLPGADIDLGSFVGTSYTVKPLIECLVREGRRDVLQELWYSISHLQYCEFTPQPIWNTYLWRSETGILTQEFFDSPQSWRKLREKAFLKPVNIPEKMEEDKAFVILFLLTFPHRVRGDLVKLIDPNFAWGSMGTTIKL